MTDKSILDHFVVIPEREIPQLLLDHSLLLPDSVRALPEVAPLLPIVESGAVTFPVYLDNSMIEAFSLCKYKGFTGYIRNIVPIGTNVHLHFGGAMAKALEVTRRSFYGKEKHLDDAIEDGLVALWKTWGDYVPSQDRPTAKTIDRLECAFVAYWDHWDPRKDFLQPVMVNGEPSVEFTFAVPLPGSKHPETGEEILIVGRFDLMAQFTAEAYKGGLFVDDEKTSTSLGPTWREQWHLSPQMTTYVWAARSYRSIPALGAIVRGIGILKTDIKFEQVLTMRSEWLIGKWLTRTNRIINEMIECWRSKEWPQIFNAVCNMYGGCPYRLLCSKQNPDQWLEGNYKTHVWDPLSKD